MVGADGKGGVHACVGPMLSSHVAMVIRCQTW
jgi:hypothetical protein